jgi:hypothetical protein
MVYFRTENPNLGKFWTALEWRMLVYLFNGHLEYFTAICYMYCVMKNLATFVGCYKKVSFFKKQPCSLFSSGEIKTLL